SRAPVVVLPKGVKIEDDESNEAGSGKGWESEKVETRFEVGDSIVVDPEGDITNLGEHESGLENEEKLESEEDEVNSVDGPSVEDEAKTECALLLSLNQVLEDNLHITGAISDSGTNMEDQVADGYIWVKEGGTNVYQPTLQTQGDAHLVASIEFDALPKKSRGLHNFPDSWANIVATGGKFPTQMVFDRLKQK
ncbi:hypothetical protein U1Q18_002962, partial [Sarracenia purpurea var. burkii]